MVKNKMTLAGGLVKVMYISIFFVVFIAAVGSFYFRDSQDIFYCLFRAVAGYLGVPLDIEFYMTLLILYSRYCAAPRYFYN